MRETAFAKINLALHVRAREPDGYHRIETVFAFAEDGDLLEVREGGELSLEVEGPFSDRLSKGDDNLVVRAARALAAAAGIEPSGALLLDKRLPVASGIGGGSADAAAALRLLSRWWNVDVAEQDLLAIAAGLGADVPACLLSRTARGEGRGDRLEPLEEAGLAGTPLLLVNPGVPVSTEAIFRGWDGTDRGPLGSWRDGRNDLEAPARAIAPEVRGVLGALCEAPVSRMSGSGATCFGLYDSIAERDAAAAAISQAQPGWWTLATRLR